MTNYDKLCFYLLFPLSKRKCVPSQVGTYLSTYVFVLIYNILLASKDCCFFILLPSCLNFNLSTLTGSLQKALNICYIANLPYQCYHYFTTFIVVPPKLCSSLCPLLSKFLERTFFLLIIPIYIFSLWFQNLPLKFHCTGLQLPNLMNSSFLILFQPMRHI